MWILFHTYENDVLFWVMVLCKYLRLTGKCQM